MGRLAPYAAAIALCGLATWRIYAWGYSSAEQVAAIAIAEQAAELERTARLRLEERERRRAALARELEKSDAELEIMRGKLAAGAGRVFVRANCPTMPVAAPDAGGAGGGAAELDPAARPDYLVLRAALTRQYELLQFCRAELRARSGVTDQ